MKNPTEKVRSKYSVLYSEGSPRCARDDAENQLSLRRKRSDEANSREGGFPQGICFITSVVGYFAALNITRKEKRDISLALNMTRKEKTGYFAALNMT